MIPRYDPTFQFQDLITAFQQSAHADSMEILSATLKEYYGVKHVFTFDSAKIAIFALLKAYNQPGGVLIPAYTCIVVPETVYSAGYKPVFADIDPYTLNFNTETLKKALTPEVTIIMPTHLFGVPCDLDEVMAFGRKHNLLIVEDAAPALGAEFRGRKVGIFGDAAVVSFQATKVISSEGGGALLTNNDDLAERINKIISIANPPPNRWIQFQKAISRKLVFAPRLYPLALMAYKVLQKESMYEVVDPAIEDPDTFLKPCSPFTSKLASLQMDRLGWNLSRRRSLAKIYSDELAGHPHIQMMKSFENSNPSWIQFPILVKDKGRFYRFMQKHGIDLSWTYKYSCAESYKQDGFPNALTTAQTILGLPTYPSLSDEQAGYICSIAKKYSETEKG